MGWRDFFRRKPVEPQAHLSTAAVPDPEVTRVGQPAPLVPKRRSVPPAPKPQPKQRAPKKNRAAARNIDWIPAGQSVVVQGRTITGGMVYVGTRAASVDGTAVEPALVDPSLQVNWNNPDWAGETMGYWPSYEGMDERARAAYLGWLADGRSQVGAYIGYVFVFFYGLERRLLTEAANKADDDLPAIKAEVSRLLDIYGDNYSFESYATGLLQFIGALEILSVGNEPAVIPWDPDYRGWEVPLTVRLAIGTLTSEGRPLPADWALSFLRYHPESYLRTPATRCQSEFDQLFVRRYNDKYGEGLEIRAPKNGITFSYRPASASFGGEVGATLSEAPDIMSVSGPIDALKDLAADCTDDLDAYSRLLGRRPEEAGSAVAAALLPDELLESLGGPVLDGIRDWTTSTLRDQAQATISLDDLVEHWAPGRTEKLAKRDAVSIAALLGKIGVGVEPDVRFGAATPKPGTSAVLFSLPEKSPVAPSAEYTAAMSLVHFTAVVAAADGHVSDSERRHLAAHIEDVLGLDAAETTRLEAHLTFLATGKLGMAGMKKRIDALSEEERFAVGRFLVDVAAADGVVSPEEISVLTKLFVRLGLDEADVFRQVHNLGSGDSGPITVSDGDAETRWQIPDGQEAQTRVKPFALDPAKVQARLAETAHVTALLSGIFSEDDPPDEPAHAQASSASNSELAPSVTHDLIGTLDSAHSALAASLAAEAKWLRSDAESLADSLGLPLLAGALDRINEEAMDECGEPLIEGDEPLILNSYAIEEMLP